ncbi:T9SS type A sorting domain-containing protein [bacterium]|nr:T9SS type A sorting domain-containing protein [bacterium]
MTRCFTQLCFLLLFCTATQAQLNYGWGHHYGGAGLDRMNDIDIDENGNVYAIGEFEYSIFRVDGKTDTLVKGGYRQAIMLKLDAAGDTIWTRQLGGTAFDRGTGIALDGNGNFYITGVISNTVDMDPGSGVFEINADSSGYGPCVYLAKFDTDGNFKWAKAFHNTTGTSAADLPSGVDCDSEGNVYIGGAFFSTMQLSGSVTLTTPGSLGEAYLAKFNSNGKLLWGHAIGGIQDQRILQLKIDPQDNVLITGFYFGTTDFDPGAGTANHTSNGQEDIFIAKYNKNGEYQWSIGIGSENGSAVSVEAGLDIEADASGNVFVAGRILGDVDFDPSADSAMLFFNTVNNSFLVKYDASGNFLNVLSIKGSSFHVAQALAIDDNSNCYLAGKFGGELKLDPSKDTVILFSNSNDVYLAKYTNNLEFIDAINMRGSGEENTTVLSSGNGDVFWGGYFSSNFIAGPRSAPVFWLGAGVQDMFILKFTENATIGIPTFSAKELGIYPNPSTGNITLDTPKSGTPSVLIITDLSGNVVMQQELLAETQKLELNLSELSAGAYFIQINSKNKLARGTVILQ